MESTHPAPADPHAPGERPYFPAATWDLFAQDDAAAGKAVVGLMTTIFSIGLVLYIIVLISCL
jgi:hypothetical protein